MALTDRKITSYQSAVSALPDRPADSGFTAAALKAVFDARTDGEVKAAVNGIIDDLTDGTAASEIKCGEKTLAEMLADITENAEGVAANKADVTALAEGVAANTQDIAALEADVAANTQDIAALETDVAANKADVTALAEGVAANTQDIAALEADVAANTDHISVLYAETAALDAKMRYTQLARLTVTEENAAQIAFEEAGLSDFTFVISLPPVANTNGVLYLRINNNNASIIIGTVSASQTKYIVAEAHNVGVWRVDWTVSASGFSDNASSKANVSKSLAQNADKLPQTATTVSLALGALADTTAMFPAGTEIILYGRKR